MIEATQLSKSYKNHKAVKNINLYLDKGESVGLLGPNGAGKSTTISMLATLLKPSSGKVTYLGQDVHAKPQTLRDDLGLIPQEIALYPELSAYENMKFFGKAYKLSGQYLEDKIQEVLKIVGLEDRQKDKVENFSGGMKRRINIAVALMHDPRILIMDEPTVGIDPQSRNYILEMIKQLNEDRGLTVLYTSHYMEEVERLCDRIYIMDHGEIIAAGTKEELKNIISNEESVELEVIHKDESFANDLSDQVNINRVSESKTGYSLIVTKGDQILSQVFDLAKVHNVKIKSMTVMTPSLEDVFLHLTGRRLRD